MSKRYRPGDAWRRPTKRSRPGPPPDLPPQPDDPSARWESWNDAYEGLGGRGWYEGWVEALHRPQGPFVGRGPRNYTRSDARILEDVNERLTEHGMLDATDIEVSVHDGEVTLRGHVDTRHDKRLAEDIADFVMGVKDVHNEIKIRQKNPWDQIEGSEKKRRAG
jgi:hypothetical protein